MGVAQILGHLLGLHHGGAPLGERGFLAGLRRELAEFLDRVAQPVAFALGALDLGAMGVGGALRLAPRLPQRATLAASASRPPKASSRRRWVAASTKARSSCWPWISTSAVPSCFSTCTLTG